MQVNGSYIYRHNYSSHSVCSIHFISPWLFLIFCKGLRLWPIHYTVSWWALPTVRWYVLHTRGGSGLALLSSRKDWWQLDVYVTNFLFIECLFQQSPSKPVLSPNRLDLTSLPKCVTSLMNRISHQETAFTEKRVRTNLCSITTNVRVYTSTLVLRHNRCPMSTNFYPIMSTVHNLCLL
jgi:hypothetical protein